MIKAIFFDIDGTLRDFEEKGIPEYTRRALDMAREAGLRLCIATGRSAMCARDGSFRGGPFTKIPLIRGR